MEAENDKANKMKTKRQEIEQDWASRKTDIDDDGHVASWGRGGGMPWLKGRKKKDNASFCSFLIQVLR